MHVESSIASKFLREILSPIWQFNFNIWNTEMLNITNVIVGKPLSIATTYVNTVLFQSKVWLIWTDFIYRLNIEMTYLLFDAYFICLLVISHNLRQVVLYEI